ncbi:MAG TPA: TIM barrel protein [Thermoguttaceae bacterium]|nr:TIM barrel protein [Thermoguttaceae bacterium]
MSQVTRRTFLTRSAAVGAVAGLSGLGGLRVRAAEPLVRGMPNTQKLGWRVGFSAYSFRTVTLFESLEKMAATGLHYTELFAWQKLSPADPDAMPTAGLSPTLRKDLRKKAADSGVQMIGLYTALKDRESAKAVFEFAAETEVEAIVAEPPAELLDRVEELTDEYHVDLALHNHPKPSTYWNPETGLAAMEGRSQRMGFCCDTGHWCRCGLDPVETLKKVGPRVKTFHLKDLDQFGVRDAKDVIWGQGKGRIPEILAEVKRLGIKNPYFGIEWERDPNESLETHAKSAAYFEQVAGKLVAS